MAVWKKEKKKSSKKKKNALVPQNIVGPVIFIAAVVIVALLLFTAQPEAVAALTTLSIATSEQPGAVGFHEIYITSNQPLASVSVLVNGKPATQKAMAGNTYTFEFFATPYEAVGVKPIVVDATDSLGRTIHDESKGFYVGYDAVGDKVMDIIFYTYEQGGYTPIDMAQWIVFEDNKTLNLFYELVDEGGHNQASINAMVPLIQNLSHITSDLQQKPFNHYLVTVQGREWVSCMDNTTAIVPLEECRRILDEENSIILRYPYYPSAQVFVTNTTIELQPAPFTQGYVVEAMQRVMGDMFFAKALQQLEEEDMLAREANATAANETVANETSLVEL